jgi:hypothetical protein
MEIELGIVLSIFIVVAFVATVVAGVHEEGGIMKKTTKKTTKKTPTKKK